MEPCPVLRAALWKYTEFIAVIQIQRPEAGYLAHLLPLAHRIDLLPLFRSLWMGNLRQGLGQNTPPYPIFGVCRPKVPGKAHKALLSGRSHGDVLAELHRIALLAQQVIKLLFADAFPDQLVAMWGAAPARPAIPRSVSTFPAGASPPRTGRIPGKVRRRLSAFRSSLSRYGGSGCHPQRIRCSPQNDYAGGFPYPNGWRPAPDISRPTASGPALRRSHGPVPA